MSASALSAVGLLVVMSLSASAQLIPDGSQMTPEPNADEPGSTGVIRDDAAVESNQMEGDMMTPSTGTNNTSPTYSSPTTTTPSTTTPAASTNTSPRALW